jgi:hypothetical protein
MSSRRLMGVLGVVLGMTVLTASGLSAKSPQILEFDTMVGVPQALTGSASPIRGVSGGGLPWAITAGTGELSASGLLEIHVTGLVLAAGPSTGSNPIASFRGLVSCLDASGNTVNIATDPFPATTGPATSGGGNARIEAALTLPDPCIAPIIFVTSPGGSWFASTGG